MNDEAITQEHERTVSEARSGMSYHDTRAALHRWFENYKDKREAYFHMSGWVTVVRDGHRWKIEMGYYSSGDAPLQTVYADPSAPQPPIFEFRAPKPEPVKPRFNVPEPRSVPAWDRGGLSYSAVVEMMRLQDARLRMRAYEYIEPRRYSYLERPMFDRVTAPTPPPPTRRNQ